MPRFVFQLIIQAFLAALLSWLVVTTMELIGLDEIGHSHQVVMIIRIIRPVVVFAGGLLLGAAAYTWWKKIRRSALWAWVLPTGILAFALGHDTWRAGWNRIVPEYFVWMRPGLDEPPLVLYMLVLPTVAALSYSLGAFISKRGGWSRFTDADSASKLDIPSHD